MEGPPQFVQRLQLSIMWRPDGSVDFASREPGDSSVKPGQVRHGWLEIRGRIVCVPQSGILVASTIVLLGALPI